MFYPYYINRASSSQKHEFGHDKALVCLAFSIFDTFSIFSIFGFASHHLAHRQWIAIVLGDSVSKDFAIGTSIEFTSIAGRNGIKLCRDAT